jgi:hypothetical protein
MFEGGQYSSGESFALEAKRFRQSLGSFERRTDVLHRLATDKESFWQDLAYGYLEGAFKSGKLTDV